MRKFLILLLCCMLFVTTVYADNAAASVQTNAAVASDGSCQISMSMTLRLDEPVSGLMLALGSDVSSVRVNGSSADLKRSGGITSVKLDGAVAGLTGNVSVTVSFTTNSVISVDEEGKQLLTVPLLYGLPYPVEQMSFAITMPGEFDAVPTFLSGYHDQDIESSITSAISAAGVTGTVNTTLKDHETLFMTLQAPEGMFPQALAAGGSVQFDITAMWVCGALALAYWLLTMACAPRFPKDRSAAPEGVTAGAVGCYLAHKKADLTMMVVTWAQLGYLLIHLNENGRVMLHKKMEMGNERSSFERRAFRDLFVKASMIDTSGYRYARLREKTAAASRRHHWGYEKRSGNPYVLRILGCGIGLFAGLAMGDSMTTAPAWRVLLMILMAGVVTLGCWYMHSGTGLLRLRGRTERIVSAVWAGVILILGAVSGCMGFAVVTVCANLLIGLLAANTGKRTENGKRTRDEILGLRRYMRRVSGQELMRIIRANPDYFYELAPYALALGVDRQFARRFGRVRQPQCVWLVTDMGGAVTAAEWNALLRDAVDAMNNFQQRPFR